MILEIRHIMNGAVEINIFIIISAGIFRKIIHSAHRYTAIYEIRPFEKQISAMQCAERRAAGVNSGVPTRVVFYKRNQLIIHVIIPLFVHIGFVKWMCAVIHPAVVIYTVNRKYFDLAAIYER